MPIAYVSIVKKKIGKEILTVKKIIFVTINLNKFHEIT